MYKLTRRTTDNSLRAVLSGLIALILTTFAATSAVAQEVDRVDPTIAEDIPHEANRVILVADPELPREPEMTTKSLFEYAVTALTDEGYEIAVLDYGTYTLSTKAAKLKEDLFVKVDLNVMKGEVGEGEQIIAAAMWSPTGMADEIAWHEARWTEGNAKIAFGEVVHALSDIQHSLMYTESRLGAMERSGS